jgi:hypothetical protein
MRLRETAGPPRKPLLPFYGRDPTEKSASSRKKALAKTDRLDAQTHRISASFPGDV